MRVMRLCDDAVEGVRELGARAGRARRALPADAGGRGVHAPAAGAAGAGSRTGGWRTSRRSSATRSASRRRARPRPTGCRSARARSPARRSSTTAPRSPRGSASAGSPTNSVDAVGDRDFALEYLNAGGAARRSPVAPGRGPGAVVLAGVRLVRGARRLLDRLEPAAAEAQPRRVRAGARQERAADRQRRSGSRSLLKGLPVRVPEGSAGGQGSGVRHRRHAVDGCSRRWRRRSPRSSREPRTHAPRRSRPTCSPSSWPTRWSPRVCRSATRTRGSGALWAAAEQAGVAPAALPETERLALSPHFTDARLAALTVEAALARRDHAPGGGPHRCATQLARAEARLGLGPRRRAPTLRVAGWRDGARRRARGAPSVPARRRGRRARQLPTPARSRRRRHRAPPRARSPTSPASPASWPTTSSRACCCRGRSASCTSACASSTSPSATGAGRRVRRAARAVGRPGRGALARRASRPPRPGPRRARWSKRVVADARALGAAARHRADPRGGILRALRLRRRAARVAAAQGVDRLRALPAASRLRRGRGGARPGARRLGGRRGRRPRPGCCRSRDGRTSRPGAAERVLIDSQRDGGTRHVRRARAPGRPARSRS